MKKCPTCKGTGEVRLPSAYPRLRAAYGPCPDCEQEPIKIDQRIPAVSRAEFLEVLKALRLINAHYNDLSASNPGFIGKLCLQNYKLWNEALLESERVLAKYKNHLTP